MVAVKQLCITAGHINLRKVSLLREMVTRSILLLLLETVTLIQVIAVYCLTSCIKAFQ